ncbi:hypothetical protein DEU56DRAFT_837361 [Suillus clintonianus]|uniref:uncharacterized protein n=1 Tax=Suillus clintonianus TaxID=1904413 RepID=UPI001B881727|nr:uncharacterized protein DEU56DRAFT_837361 [Suillus clintonianus]KAG2119201.1 hypothetical protein DEU56DRAFT_837361 [Suillus clintonianus]
MTQVFLLLQAAIAQNVAYTAALLKPFILYRRRWTDSRVIVYVAHTVGFCAYCKTHIHIQWFAVKR